MTVHRGRVLVIEERSVDETAALWDRMREQGFELAQVPMSASAEAVSRDGRPDVLVLNMLAAEMADARPRYLDAAARLAMAQGSRRMPVIAVGETGGTGRPPIGIAEVLPRPLSAARLAARVSGLRRLATIQAEARRRIETAADFGVEASDIAAPAAEADANILVVGAGIRYLAVERALARQSVIVGAFTPATALDYLARRSFDAVVVNMKFAQAVAFLRELRADVAHFGLPAIVLADEVDAGAVEALFEAGATDLVLDAAVEAELPSAARNAVSEHKFREAMRAVYARGRHLVTSDSLTGLYSRGFFMAHLDRVLADGESARFPVAVVGVTIPELAEVNRDGGWHAGDHLLRQVGSLLGRLVRAEDLTGRIGGGRFGLIMPAAGTEEAETATRRLGAVLRSTRFALPGLARSVAVAPEFRVVTADPGDDAVSLVARLVRP